MEIKRRVFDIGRVAFTGALIGVACGYNQGNNTPETTPVSNPNTLQTSGEPRKTSHADYDTLIDEADFQIAQANLLRTIDWMELHENPRIQVVAKSLREDVKRENFTISGSNNKEAYVPPISRSQKPKVAFSIGALSAGGFSEENAAMSLFEASYVFEKACEDPERFSLDLAYKLSLELEAQTLSSQAFSLAETR